MEIRTGCPPSGSLYEPTTHPPAFSIAVVSSAAGPEGSVIRHSAGPRPLVPGFALRGRFLGGARFTIENSHFSPPGASRLPPTLTATPPAATALSQRHTS